MQPVIHHPYLRHPLTGAPLTAVGVRPDGRPIWPILGGNGEGGGQGGDGGAGGQGGGGNGSSGAGSAGQGGQGGQGQGGNGGQGGSGGAGGQGNGSSGGDLGFPPNTPVAEMTDKQAAAYWKHQSRQHEQRNRAYGNLTPEQLQELRTKAERADALEYDLSSDKDKAVADATKAASDAKDAEYRPLLVAAKFEAVSAGRIEPEKLATILEPLDLTKFLTADGKVDTAKVQSYVDGIAPARGNNNGGQPLGPSGAGAGRRQSSQTGSAFDRGRAEAQRRFGERQNA